MEKYSIALNILKTIGRTINPLCHLYCYWFSKKGIRRPILGAIYCWWDWEILPWFSNKHIYNGGAKTFVNGKPSIYYYRWQSMIH